MKQIGLGLHNFHDTYGNFPPGAPNDDNVNHTWSFYILPYIEQGAIYNQCVNNGVVLMHKGGNNLQYVQQVIPAATSPSLDQIRTQGEIKQDPTRNVCLNIPLAPFMCPSDVLPEFDNEGWGKSNYCANLGWAFGDFGCAKYAGSLQQGILVFSNNNNTTYVHRFADVTDGTSNTVIVGEATLVSNMQDSDGVANDSNFPIWTGGNGGCDGNQIGSWARLMDTNFYLNRQDSNNAELSFGSQHPGGGMFLFADGSTHFISENINITTYRNLGARNDGFAVQIP
jgi:prepilin-type processing-associated H-X9-DG protein